MAFLVRKFSRGKWGDNIPATVAGIASDAITSCLRTSNKNTLSLWRIADRSAPELEKAELALAGSLERIQTFDYLVIPEADVLATGVTISPTPGATVAQHLRNLHVDLVDLTYSGIGSFADLMRPIIHAEQHTRVPVRRIKELLNNAHANQQLDLTEMKDSMKKDLGLAYGAKCIYCVHECEYPAV